MSDSYLSLLMLNRLSYIVLSIILLFIGTVTLTAQTCLVKGTVLGGEDNHPLDGANIACTINSERKYVTSDKEGKYQINVPRGHNITVKVSYVGYRPTSVVINCSSNTVVKNITLRPDNKSLSEVVVAGKGSLAYSRGDTTVYKASMYKVNEDATAFDLVSQGKMPGLGLQDGKLKAHGEEVQEILVDGKEFFKSDIDMALKNLPANILNEVQVFDKKSDYAELTGFDDGNTHKTINLVTQKGTNKSSFGKFYGGYGIEERYKLYGMTNIFDDDMRLSVFAQWNNVNEQNFSMIDLLSATGTASSSAPSQSPYSKNSVDNTFHPTASDDVTSMMIDVSDGGITTSKAAGTNYSDVWNKGKIKFSGHYLFNSAQNETEYGIYDEYYGKNTSDNKQKQMVNTDNLNHRFNSKIEYNITEKDFLLFRPSITYQKKDENSKLIDWTCDSTETSLLLNQGTITDQYVISNSDEVMYLHKFDNRGHALSFDGRFSYIKTIENIDMNFENVQANQEAIQETYSYNIQKTYTAVGSYTVPFNRYSRLKLDAGWNITYGTIKRKTELKADGAEEFKLDSLLCGTTRSNFGGLLGNLSFLYNRKGMNIVSGIEYHMYNFKTKNDITHSFYSYNTFLPFFIMRYRFGTNQLHVQYRTSQKFPGLLQVQDAINNANASMAVRGNSTLQAAYHHNLSLRLVMPNNDIGSIGVFFMNFEQADNYIASKRSLSSSSFTGNGDKRNSEMFSYENADGFISLSSLLAYGFPVRKISSNLNISTLVQYSKVPGFWDNEKTFNNAWVWNTYFTVGSNISKNIDFVLDFNCKYNQSRNQKYSNYDVSYWSLSYGGQVNWQIIPAIKIVLECGHTNYYGSGTSKYNALISNAAIAYKFLKGRKGELRLSCNDIFNKNNNFYQTTNEIYRREVTTNVLKRYALLTFTYNFNKQQK